MPRVVSTKGGQVGDESDGEAGERAAFTSSALTQDPGDLSDDSPELLEDEDGRGGLANALRRRGGRGGTRAPTPFSVLQYPLLRLGDDDVQTKSEATLNLLNNLLGAGILAMPRAMANAGVIGGLLIMAFVAVANRYTLLLVLWMSETVLEETSYPEIGRHIFGGSGLLAVLLAYLLFTGGILTAYLIALVDILREFQLFAQLPRIVLVCIAVVICAPGSLLRSLRHVALLSGVCMAAICTLVLSITAMCIGDFMSAKTTNVGRVELFRREPSGLLAAVALFALQFSVQAGGIEVLSRIATDENAAAGLGHEASSIPAAQGVSKVAFCIAVVLSATIGTTAYLRFGDEVQGDVLLNFGPQAPQTLLLVARTAFGFAVTCSFAFIMVPCRFAVVDLFSLRRRGQSDADALPPDRHRKVSASALGICALAAWLVPDLAQMLEFVGVWATMALAFVLPCAFLMELRRRQENLPLWSPANALPLFLIACGVAVATFSSAGFLVRILSVAPGGASGDRTEVKDIGSALSGNITNAGRLPMPSAVVSPLDVVQEG